MAGRSMELFSGSSVQSPVTREAHCSTVKWFLGLCTPRSWKSAMSCRSLHTSDEDDWYVTKALGLNRPNVAETAWRSVFCQNVASLDFS
jgi:hypothetical protein